MLHLTIAFGSEGLKSFQLRFKFGHAVPLTPVRGQDYAFGLCHGQHRYPVELFFALLDETMFSVAGQKRTTPPERNMIARRRWLRYRVPQIPQ
jgi:hypothetical protein